MSALVCCYHHAAWDWLLRYEFHTSLGLLLRLGCGCTVRCMAHNLARACALVRLWGAHGGGVSAINGAIAQTR